MPTVYGDWAPSVSTNRRMRLILMYDVPTPTLGQTSVTVTGSVILAAGYSFNDSSNTFEWSGSLLGSGSTSKSINVSTNDSATIHTFSKTVTLAATAQGFSVAFSLSGVEYVGATASVSDTVTVPAAVKPARPTSVTGVKTGTSSVRLTWGGGNVHEIVGRRRSTKGSSTAAWLAYETIASGSTYASGTGVTVADGYEWQFAVRRRSGVMWSDYGYSSAVRVWTVPATPTGVTITRAGTDVRVSWSGAAVDQVQVRARSVKGSGTASWAPWRTVASSPTASGTAFAVEGGYDWQARVRRYSDGMWSDYGTSSGYARLMDAPAAPRALNASRSSDARHSLSWTVGSVSPMRPILHFEVRRWLLSTGASVTVQSPGSRVSTWLDTANIPNDQVRYAIRTVNAAGQSAFTYSPYLHTTPAKPTNVTAGRSGSSNIALSFTSNARAGVLDVLGQSSADGVTWTALAAVSGHTGITAPAVGSKVSRTLTGLDPARLWRFAVDARTTSPVLTARSATSGIVQLLAPPNAPSILAPTATQSSQDVSVMRWRHNPTDGSDQTAAELWHRIDGGEWITATETTVEEYAAGPLSPGTVEWQVRTRGAHATFGPWSAISTFLVADPPSVTILSPVEGETLNTNRLTLLYLYTDAQDAPMVRWTRRLYLNSTGELLEEVSGQGAPESITFDTVLANGEHYAAELEAVSGVGLRSQPAGLVISAVYLPPVPPLLDATWADGGVTLTVTNLPGEPPATDEAVANRIERSANGGLTWVPLIDGLGVNAGWEDRSVPLNSSALYRAVAITELGVEAASEPLEVATPDAKVWLDGEDGISLYLYASLSLSAKYDVERVSEQYYGRTKPTVHYGDARPVSVSVGGVVPGSYGADQIYTLLLGQDVFFRDPEQRAWWGSVEGLSVGQTVAGWREVSMTVEAVEHGS